MVMKKYEMTEDEYAALIKAASTPGVFVGGILKGYDPARAASEKLWKEMGEKYGFKCQTVRACGPHESNLAFYAEPKDE